MWKIARRTLTALSMLLLLATLAAWGRAQLVRDVVLWTSVGASPGQVDVTTRRLSGERRGLELFEHRRTYPAENEAEQALLLREIPREPAWRHRTFPPERLASGGFEWRRTGAAPPGPAQAGAPGDLAGLTYRYGWRNTAARAPWWSLALPFALAPAWSLARRLLLLRRRRRPPHACPACGYDLRATADPAGPRLPTCPECGRPTAPTPGSER